MFSSSVENRFHSKLHGLRTCFIATIVILLTIVRSTHSLAQAVSSQTAQANVADGVGAIVGGRAAEAFEQFDSNLTDGLPFEGDDVWFVDAREAHNFPGNLEAIGVRRLNCENWEPSQFQDLVQAHQSDQSKVTLVYSHGDRTNEYYAIQRGLQFYRNIFKDCPDSRASVRLVIWAWKSEKAHNRPSRDFCVKSNRARMAGTTLGSALTQFPDRNLVLVGYSLGAQSMLTALEDCSLINTPKTGQYRVCLIAPVMEGCFVSQHRCCFPFKDLVGKSVIFDNSADRAIKCSRVLGFRTAPGGQTSIQSLALNGNLPLDNISIFDLANSTGAKHSIVKYSADSTVISTIIELVAEADQQQLRDTAGLTREKETTGDKLLK